MLVLVEQLNLVVVQRHYYSHFLDYSLDYCWLNLIVEEKVDFLLVVVVDFALEVG